MIISGSTDEGFPVRCEVCGESSIVNVSKPPGDSVCPRCGSFLWVDALAEVTSDFQIVPGIRIRELVAPDRDTVLRAMVEAVAAEFDWPSTYAEELLAALCRREELGPTGIGSGFAIPHASCHWIDSCITAMAFVPKGVAFDLLDGQPVHTVFMLASPASKRGDHLRMLERIARSIRCMGSPSTK